MSDQDFPLHSNHSALTNFTHAKGLEWFEWPAPTHNALQSAGQSVEKRMRRKLNPVQQSLSTASLLASIAAVMAVPAVAL